MSKIFAKVREERSIFRSGANGLASKFLTVQQSINRSISKHRGEAFLRSLDQRLLEDAGFEPVQRTEGAQDHASRSDFLPLLEPFSWTRFGK